MLNPYLLPVGGGRVEVVRLAQAEEIMVSYKIRIISKVNYADSIFLHLSLRL